ncbi:transforming acidic coiled-coil-containing protein 3-like isoform X2 [Homarus americanus]|uniref:transforming acidic coiled-coil-containing protein 3-like isoform X2 n=1 Tax=Homarus americanus TaxID=6706 RepID=UPI001C47343D|nr:transforming acidic coiled-coil-containing protein 3-like isoform X2 [Homarus americanus]
MNGDVLDWDVGFQLLCFIRQAMGIRHAKGPTAPLGLAGPPGNPEQEAEGQKNLTVITQENAIISSPPSTPSSLPSETSSHSLSKECDTASTTEDTSFASCLTGDPSSASDTSPTSPVKELVSSLGVVKTPAGQVNLLDSSVNSVCDSVAQTNTQNGVKKDSEYESAEELDLPPDRAAVVEVQPTSENLIPPSRLTDQAEGTQQEVSVPLAVLDQPNDLFLPVHEESIIVTKTEVPAAVPVAVESPVVSTDSTPVTVGKESENLTSERPTSTPSTICDSVVIVTKREVIEESVSKGVEHVTWSKPESELDGVVTSSCSADSTRSVEVTVPQENNNNLDSTDSGEIKSGSKDIEAQSLTQDILVSKVIENESQSCQVTSDVDSELALQSESQVIGEKQKSEGEICSKHIVETPELAGEQAEKHQTRETKDSTTEYPTPEVTPTVTAHSLEASREEQQQQPPPTQVIDPDDIPIVAKKSYNLDFLDALDDPNFNPFATKTSVRSSPPPTPDPGCKLPPLKPAVRKKKGGEERKKVSEEVKTPPVAGHTVSEAKVNEDQTVSQRKQETNSPDSSSFEVDQRLPVPGVTTVDDLNKNIPEIPSEGIEQPQKSEQLLEITFDEPVNSISRPPRKLGKKPQLKQQRQPVKKTPPKTKVIEKNNNRVEDESITESDTKPEQGDDDLPIPPSKGYNLDFLNNLDDGNFNPFATKCSVSNSPPREGFTLPDDKEFDKPKPKTTVPAKEAHAKKGFSVIKPKAKTNVPAADESDSPQKIVEETVKLETDSLEKSGEKTAKLKVVSPQKSVKETSKLEPVVNHCESNSIKPTEEEEEIPIRPKGGYNLDFLDDPNFNPFQTRSPLESKTLNVTESEPVPKDIVVAKENCVSEEVDSYSECDKQSVVVPKTQSDSNEEQPSQTPQKEVKEESGPIIEKADKEETRERETLVDEREEIKIVEDKVQVVNESQQVAALREPQGCEEKTKAPEEETPDVTDSLSRLAKEKFESDAELSQLKRNAQISEEVSQALRDLKQESRSEFETEDDSRRKSENDISETEKEFNLPKVPSIGTIGQLDSLEFAQLLGNEASRLAEEFMNCSTDSGLPDSDDSSCVKPNSVESVMADTNCTKSPQYGAHLDENVNPFQRHSRLSRSPPLGKREAVCGAESGDSANMQDPFNPRRSLKRESVMGEERLDTLSLDDDSGIVLGTRSDLETEVNHSEAGPEIATGLTSSDLRCASQLNTEEEEEELSDQITDEEFLASEAFFKEATDMENQLRKTLTSPLMGSHSKLSGDEVVPVRDKKDHPAITPESPQNKPAPSTSSPAPPREERSAPEGTSSPTPRPSDTSEHKPSSSRPSSVPSEGYMTAAEVQELLKHQELKFEEKLLQVELTAGEKEKKLRQTMKDEQKELTNLGESMAELTQSRDALLKMVGQYKGMLAQLVSEKEKEKQSAEERIKALELERNQALEDLANVEVAFSDVHRKYERIKQVIDTLKRNEETLRGAVTDYENKLQKQEEKFVEFQKHAEEKIQLANEEFKTMRKANDQEMTKMAALLKKAEMKIMSLQDSFDRKTRENQELTQLCDDLINKVGSSS